MENTTERSSRDILRGLEDEINRLDDLMSQDRHYGDGELAALQEARSQAGRKAIIMEISVEIDDGDAAIYTRNEFVKFFNWLTTNTDTFDRVMVMIEKDLGDDHTLDADLVEGLVKEFVKTIGKD